MLFRSFSRRLWRKACDGFVVKRKGREDVAYGPLVPGLTPHDLRHSSKTWMIEDGHPEVVQAERLGHTVPGVRGIYSHVTDEMRQRVVDGMQARWERAYTERLKMGAPTTLCLPLFSQSRSEALPPGGRKGL